MMTFMLVWASAALLSAAVVIAADPQRPKAPSKPTAPASPGTEKPGGPTEQMDNPQFLAWKKFDVGASSTLTMTIESGQQGFAMELETVQKLAEKADDHVVLEATPTMKILDNVQQLPAQRQNVPSKTEKKDLKKFPDEKVKAAGQTFVCKVYQMKQPNPRGGGEIEAKVWMSDKVPGGTVKLEGTAERAKFIMLLKSFSDK
jgi:hypothetical protein